MIVVERAKMHFQLKVLGIQRLLKQDCVILFMLERYLCSFTFKIALKMINSLLFFKRSLEMIQIEKEIYKVMNTI